MYLSTAKQEGRDWFATMAGGDARHLATLEKRYSLLPLLPDVRSDHDSFCQQIASLRQAQEVQTTAFLTVSLHDFNPRSCAFFCKVKSFSV